MLPGGEGGGAEEGLAVCHTGTRAGAGADEGEVHGARRSKRRSGVFFPSACGSIAFPLVFARSWSKDLRTVWQ